MGWLPAYLPSFHCFLYFDYFLSFYCFLHLDYFFSFHYFHFPSTFYPEQVESTKPLRFLWYGDLPRQAAGYFTSCPSLSLHLPTFLLSPSLTHYSPAFKLSRHQPRSVFRLDYSVFIFRRACRPN